MSNAERRCRICGLVIDGGSICDECAVCYCGSGRPPGLCHGISRRERPQIRRSEIVEFSLAHSQAEAAREFGLSRQRVSQILRERLGRLAARGAARATEG